ncbi:hypothetical protein Tco_1205893 [Tanacetum coccineum]
MVVKTRRAWALKPTSYISLVLSWLLIPCYPEGSLLFQTGPIVAPRRGKFPFVSPTGVLDLLDYSSSSDSDPSEDSLPHIPDLPLVSPSGSSSHDTFAPSSEFPLAPIVAPPRIRTTSHHLDHLFRSSIHSSIRSITTGIHSGHSLSGHTPPDTTDADTSTPPRFVHRSLARTLRRSKAFRRWRSAPLSTPYPPTTSESSLEALAAYEATRAANALEAESQSQNGSDGDNGNGGDGNGGDGNGGNGNPNKNNRGVRHVAQECTYQDFMKCQPLNFKGTEGVVGLIRWFEKMETVFHISNCLEKYQVKYATCTLLNSDLTWWSSHKRTVRTEAEFAMSWRELIKLMAEVYCPRNGIQKMESEL